MEHGKIVEKGTPAQLLLKDPANDLQINNDTYFAQMVLATNQNNAETIL